MHTLKSISIYTIELYHVLQKFDVSCQLLITVDDEEEARLDFRMILEAIYKISYDKNT